MSFEGKIEQLIESSAAVFKDCALDNGAILAANSDNPVYPETAVNYRYVWPRDAAFVIYAAERLGMSPDIKTNFVGWLLDRAEDFSQTGTIIKRYSTNGRHDLAYGAHYQPDQAGAMLWALHSTTEDPDKKIDEAIQLLATGLSRQWQADHFSHPLSAELSIQDLWEDQEIASDEPAVFTYSLATAIRGLEQASIRLGDEAGAIADDWAETTASMRAVLGSAASQLYYPWKIPLQTGDRAIDASQSGLVWPFKTAAYEVDPKASDTLHKIEETLYDPRSGTKRFAGDTYDGVLSSTSLTTEAGTWPLLSFWQAIALSKAGSTQKAREIYQQTLEMIPDDCIPEQILPAGRSERPPTPLAWAHAMFILASGELGYLES